MRLTIPDFGLVILIGASGAGKSSFAQRCFRRTEILSSDHYRGVVGDEDRSQRTTDDAFAVIEAIAARRLAARRLTVIDATNLVQEHRRRYCNLSRAHHAPATAIVFDVAESDCQAHNYARGQDAVPPHVVSSQCRALSRTMGALSKDGFRRRHRLRSAAEVKAAEIERQPLACDARERKGPFDLIGDVHGCLSELLELLAKLGYEVTEPGERGGEYRISPPKGRTAVFLGDMVDRGPDSAGVIRLVRAMVAAGAALALPGNHDDKLARALRGHDVQRTHGLAKTMAQFEALTAEEEALIAKERAEASTFIRSLPSHYVLDRGRLVAAHAGMTAELQLRSSIEVREFGLYGATTEESDADGRPARHNWAGDYRGHAVVVYGHTPTARPEWVNNTICIDTGCVFGGRLTALRWPERSIVEVKAAKVYAEPPPAMQTAAAAPGLSAQQDSDAVLDIKEVTDRLSVHTSLMGKVKVKREQTAAALESMTRHAIDPRWLIHLPPTTAAPKASNRAGMLEHPDEPFAYYRRRGVSTVVCEEKHMGSRAIFVLARNKEKALRTFGITNDNAGVAYTRTGRRFFTDPAMEAAVLEQVRTTVQQAHDWEWCCLDTEVMPWSVKGRDLIANHYAPVAAASRMGLNEATAWLKKADERDPAHRPLLERFRCKLEMAQGYDRAYRWYSQPVDSIKDVKIAPFHVLATDQGVHWDKSHLWHLEQIDAMCKLNPMFTATDRLVVDVDNKEECKAATAWWEERTANGSEGMVIKPMQFAEREKKRLVAPALKCRGREYLRIIYGPEYSAPGQLERLRERNTGAKLRLALKEFALGLEALALFCERKPLRHIHRAVFAVLALESEPVDPRL